MTFEETPIDPQKMTVHANQLKNILKETCELLDRIQRDIPNDMPKNKIPQGFAYELFGQWFSVSSGKDILVNVLRHFSELSPTFPTQFAERMRFVGRTRPYVAKNIEDLYPGRPDLIKDHTENFYEGWYVGVNESNSKKIKLLKAACEVMGIPYGIDLRISGL